MSTSANNVDATSNCISIISSTGFPENAGAVHQDIARWIFNNMIRDDIPSQHICLITQEPPFDPVFLFA